jgi:hypothetical protein
MVNISNSFPIPSFLGTYLKPRIVEVLIFFPSGQRTTVNLTALEGGIPENGILRSLFFVERRNKPTFPISGNYPTSYLPF